MNPSAEGFRAITDPQGSAKLVSICIPAFEAQGFIEFALESVRSQTYAHWELIVVEDASTATVADAVHRFAGEVAQSVRYLAHERNLGPNVARNTAARAAQGEWLAFLDADDRWSPEHLWHLLERQAQTQADVIYSSCLLMDSATPGLLEQRSPSEQALQSFPISLFKRLMLIQPSSVLMSKASLARIGGWDATLRHCEDLELWLRAARSDLRFEFSPVDSCMYQRHEGSISRHSSKMAEALAEIYRRFADWSAIPASDRRSCLRSALTASGRLLWRRSPEKASQYFWSALKVRPGFRLMAYWSLSALLGLGQRLQRPRT